MRQCNDYYNCVIRSLLYVGLVKAELAEFYQVSIYYMHKRNSLTTNISYSLILLCVICNSKTFQLHILGTCRILIFLSCSVALVLTSCSGKYKWCKVTSSMCQTLTYSLFLDDDSCYRCICSLKSQGAFGGCIWMNDQQIDIYLVYTLFKKP